jgi:signal transduction histidine kinase
LISSYPGKDTMDHNTSAERTGSKDELLLADSFLKNIAMHNPGLVAIVRNPDLKVFYVNLQFQHYLGYSNDDLAGKGVFFDELLEPHQRDHFLNQLKNVSDNITARSSYVIYPLKNKNATRLSFYLYASPFPDSEYGQLYYILLHPDLSKWGMPFTSFDSKELFLEQFDCEDFGTFEWIIEVKRLYWSEGVYRIFEIEDTVQQVDPQFSSTFIHPADLKRVEEQTKQALESNAGLDIEFKVVTVGKNIKIIHALAKVIKNKEGKPIKFAGSIRDVTEQRSIEQDLKNKVAELNHSNRELEEFAYVASHDMQEPLRKITTFSDRLAEKYKAVLTGDGLMYLTRMMVSAENMRSLINNLLEFSKISKTVQPFEAVNLNVILRQVKTELELVVEETGTIINAEVLPVVDAIKSQMMQLFGNVISNAIKFHKTDVAPVIDIKASVLDNDEKLKYELIPGITYHRIEINDNGIGFEDEYATRIFQVFQRLHGKSEYPGSGIGLAICKKILDYHHGIIYAENVPGTGARFIFILPEHQPVL